jgi:hypothetical protein
LRNLNAIRCINATNADNDRRCAPTCASARAAELYLGALPSAPVAKASVAAADKAVL